MASKQPNQKQRLTVIIVALSLVPLLAFALGLLSLNAYREELVKAELQLFQAEAALYSTLVNAEPELLTDTGYWEQWGAAHPDYSLGVYNERAEIIFMQKGLPAAAKQKQKNTNTPDPFIWLVDAADRLINFIPLKYNLPPEPMRHVTIIKQAAEAKLARMNAWVSGENILVLTAALPLSDSRIVFLRKETRDLDTIFLKLRNDILRVFLVMFLITTLLSLYLAGFIVRPLRKLSDAAEKLQKNNRYDGEIPDFSYRNDDIAALSLSLRRMTDALKSRISSIESFAADVAHELKNPLTSIKSAVETLPRLKDEQAKADLVEIISKDLQRMSRLITDISAASRLDAALGREDRHDFDLSALLEQTRQKYTLMYPAIKIGWHIEPAITLYGSAAYFAQAIENILDNALSFSANASAPTVKLEKAGQEVKITISDSGPGIPTENMDVIFDRFYTARPREQGFGNHSGLGLAIAKQIVEAHSGTITARNRTDKSGAQFTITLSAL